MMYIRQTWFRGRFKVYEQGHTEGDIRWIATFRFREHAVEFARSLGCVLE